MPTKKRSKLGITIATSLIASFEALINLLDNSSARQALNPIAIILGYLITIGFIHIIHIYQINVSIKAYEDEIGRVEAIINSSAIETLPNPMEFQMRASNLRLEILKLKKEKANIDFLI